MKNDKCPICGTDNVDEHEIHDNVTMCHECYSQWPTEGEYPGIQNALKLEQILTKTPHALAVLTVVEEIMDGCVECEIPKKGEACPVTCEDVKNWNRVIPVWVNGKEGIERVED